MSVGTIVWNLVRETLQSPQAAARRLLGLGLGNDARWLAFALVSVLWVIVDVLLRMVDLNETPPFPGAELLQDPKTALPLNLVSNLLSAAALTLAGRFMGGRGRFIDAVLLVSWLQFVLILAFIAVTPVGLLLPALGALAMFGVILAYLAGLFLFAATLHASDNLLVTVFAVIGAYVVTILATATLLGLLHGFGVVSLPAVPQ